ncbi:F0F1 ATP synthase subunit A [Amaricoccus sp.]|uniref:F0F1 ATP synthase subunit A n=1 Tax=Amaricoccus sp. TaxID=1872485 RepID=UPI002607F015|nr:F0F1 ATP synthase subunit A [uncultured Amaricoccus sp.]
MSGEAQEGGSGFNIHPMEQFELRPLFGGHDIHWYTITNATLWMALTVVAVGLLMVFGARGRALVPSRAQSAAEVTYGFVRKMVEDVAGKQGAPYFPYVLTIFLFILFANLLGLIPGAFASTAQFAVTGLLAIAVFVSVTVIGFVKHGSHFLNLFWVSTAPTLALRIVLAVIEVISYFVRPVSHSIRLGGNLIAGHAVLKVFAGFAGALGIGAIVPIFAITAMYGLELLVAVIQAYVFAILTCVYLNDALHPGH